MLVASIWPAVTFMFVMLPGFAALVLFGAMRVADKTQKAVRKIGEELGLAEVETPEGEESAVAFSGTVAGLRLHIGCGWQKGRAMVPVGGGHGISSQKIPVSGTLVVAEIPGELGFDMLMRRYTSMWPRAFKLDDKEFDRVCLVETCDDESSARALLESADLRAELMRFFKLRWSRNCVLTRKAVNVMTTSRKPDEIRSCVQDATSLAAMIGACLRNREAEGSDSMKEGIRIRSQDSRISD